MTPPTWVWPVPSDVRVALGGEAGQAAPTLRLEEVTNPGLLLDKFIGYPWQGTRNAWGWEWSEVRKGKPHRRDVKVESQRNLLSALSRVCKTQEMQGVLKNCQARLEAGCEQLKGLGYSPRRLTLRVKWRMAVGLGLPSPFENGLVLHHLYGFPVLPGSALKGVARAWALRECAEKIGVPQLEPTHVKKWEDSRFGPTPLELLEEILLSRAVSEDKTEEQNKGRTSIEKLYNDLRAVLEEKKELLNRWGYAPCGLKEWDETIAEYGDNFSRVFGSTNAQGEVIFMDALPTSLVVNGEPIFELDVVNPHHWRYYQDPKKNAPSDSLRPKPTHFLAVRRGTEFEAWILSRESKLLDRARDWLTKGLNQLGIGAKTRAGYGQLAVSAGGAGSRGGPGHTDTLDRDLGLEGMIDAFRAADVGRLGQIVEQIAKKDPAYGRELARRLKERLRVVGQWSRANRDKLWYRKLAALMGDPEDTES